MKTYRTALILGAGLSGLGAARLLASEGTQVTVADQRPAQEIADAVRQLVEWKVGIHVGQDHLPWSAFELCVVSPGFALESDWVQAAYAISAEVMSELELGWSRHQGRTLAVTGSNGKSSAVKWCADALKISGQQVALAGNYGRSVCEAVLTEPNLDWLVLEVSSFQLETVSHFRPDIGILLNFSTNHLDRHGTMETYARMKGRLFSQMTDQDLALVPASEVEPWRGHAGPANPRWITFAASSDRASTDYTFSGGHVHHGDRVAADLRKTYWGETGSAASAAALVGAFDAAGLDIAALVSAASTFEPLPYRCQRVGQVNGVDFVNDSKSTNSAAMAHAIERMTGPIRLIAGGVPKEPSFENLKTLLTAKVESVYLIGQAAELMFSDWSDQVPCKKAGTLDEAFTFAVQESAPGEVILFSPGCASFDQYANYEVRGDHFTRLVEAEISRETS